jgi:putative colanic acid biosynthesis UDP-glucose lipid carrier transferase
MNSYRTSLALLANLQRLVDLAVIFLAGYITLYFRFGDAGAPNDTYGKWIFGAGLIFLLITANSFRSSSPKNAIKTIANISRLWAFSFTCLVIAILFTQSGNLISRIWLGTWGVAAWILLILTHLLMDALLQKISSSKLNKKKVALIGSGDIAGHIINRLNSSTGSEFILATHLNTANDAALKELAAETLDEIWIALPISSADQLPTIIKGLEHSAANIKYAPDLFTLRLINHGSSEILGVEMLNLNASPFLGEALFVKNTEDFILSLLILIAISPLMLLLAIGVKLCSSGPVFYRQERVGLNGRAFQMLKFRSMPVDVEKDGARWGGSDSKVVHPIAKWMRKLNLDELPQFINVLRGEMSIVGPRPERSEFIDHFKEQIPNYMKKHLVKAGITGWAQVHGLRGDTDLNERIEYDLYYIENWSLKLDLKIILMTILQTLGMKK